MTHVEALNLTRLPKHLVILGGGYVGLEFAQAFRRFGSNVTVIQHGPHLLSDADPDVADAVLQLLTDDGIQVLLNADLQKISGLSGQRLTLQIASPNGAATIDATDILVATGRTPNTDSLSCERAGVELDSRGFVRVNDTLQTTAPDVWAMGDCAGTPLFTHAGFDDFRIVRDNLAGKPHSKRGRLIPSCLFTDPELAHVGLTETAAKSQNIRYRLAKIPAANVLRTHTTSETRGFLKALVGDDDRILGFTAFCADASEPLATVQTAILAGVPYTLLRDAILAHPTFAEGLTVLFSTVPATNGG
jgi:pyruvate/2-oxoglutarate dehydrogenase complex dihydrolipoamide dehydrogenase (E3) component